MGDESQPVIAIGKVMTFPSKGRSAALRPRGPVGGVTLMASTGLTNRSPVLDLQTAGKPLEP